MRRRLRRGSRGREEERGRGGEQSSGWRGGTGMADSSHSMDGGSKTQVTYVGR